MPTTTETNQSTKTQPTGDHETTGGQTVEGPWQRIKSRAEDIADTATSTWRDGRDKLQAVLDSDLVTRAKRWWDERPERVTNEPERARELLVRLELIARTFDGIRLPLPIDVSLGADFLLRFIPGGALVSTGTHLYILAEGVRFGAPFDLLRRSFGRMMFDGTLEAVPVVGAILDAMHLSHSMNARDLACWVMEQLEEAGLEAPEVTLETPAPARAA